MTVVTRFAEVDPRRINRRLVRNPNYNTSSVSYKGWCYLPLREQRKPNLQDAIERDIASNGLRNPLLIWTIDEYFYLQFGGTRLRAAQNLGLESVACLVNDWDNKYPDAPEVTEDNYTEFFTDPPPWHEFGEDGFDYHYNLERMRRDAADETGFNWLVGADRATKERIAAEMPWAEDLIWTND